LSMPTAENSWLEPVSVPRGFSEAESTYSSGKIANRLATTATRWRQPVSANHAPNERRRRRVVGAEATVISVQLLEGLGLSETDDGDRRDHDEDQDRERRGQTVVAGLPGERDLVDHRDQDVGVPDGDRHVLE